MKNTIIQEMIDIVKTHQSQGVEYTKNAFINMLKSALVEEKQQIEKAFYDGQIDLIKAYIEVFPNSDLLRKVEGDMEGATEYYKETYGELK